MLLQHGEVSLVRLRPVRMTNHLPSVLLTLLVRSSPVKYRLRNDLSCVEWDVKPCSTNQPIVLCSVSGYYNYCSCWL